MKRLHLFNPENDIALAAGTANFTPPKAAVQLHRDGAMLPLWYADSGDRILAYGVNALWLENRCKTFGLDVDVFDHCSSGGFRPSPWGWSAAARRTFEREGYTPDMLPDDLTLEHWRQLSHRRTASELCSAISRRLDFEIAPAAVEVTDTNRLRTILAAQPASIVKSP